MRVRLGLMLLLCGIFVVSAELRLAVIGKPVVVWNQSRDECQNIGKNPFGHPWEQPDSMPVAWHNPLSNRSYLISATGKTYATIGASLASPDLHHDCTHQVYKAINDTRPSSFSNHQWLQATRVFPNGSGWGLIHNEFHGEMSHNQSYCSYDTRNNTIPPDCIEWSTDLGVTEDGGDTWHQTHGPLFTLPRRYSKNQKMNGYGALGSILYNQDDGFYYGHVYRSYHNDTGAGPRGTVARGVCVWRTRDPYDAASFVAWNGSNWSATWLNPYHHSSVPESELWKYTCASIDTGLGLEGAGAHPNPKKMSGNWMAPGDPSHVMLNWPEGKGTMVSYAFSVASHEAPFTKWSKAQMLDVSGWFDPHWWPGTVCVMYPSLIDHDSPFLSQTGDHINKADGLSYGLVGNASLHLYIVMHRSLIVRLPVAWFRSEDAIPAPPFPTPHKNPDNCDLIRVDGAGIGAVNGEYKKAPVPRAQRGLVHALFEKDTSHQLYCYGVGSKCRWEMAHLGHTTYYRADPGTAGEPRVPVQGWGAAGVAPFPTAHCDAAQPQLQL